MTVAGVRVHTGDCRDHMEGMAALGAEVERFDSVVTDPPYHLQSIVKRFGKTNKADDTRTSARARSRADSYGRLNAGFMGQSWDGGAVAFEVRTWQLAFDVLKPGGHLLAFGSTRNYHRLAVAIEDAGFEIRDCLMWMFATGMPKSHRVTRGMDNADDREQWEGWGTGLKPAWEPICMARKPIEESTVPKNVLKHGTGATNIGATMIEGDDAPGGPYTIKRLKPGAELNRTGGNWRADAAEDYHGNRAPGRWPANIVHDGTGPRFFFSAKAGPDDRAGSDHPTVKPVALMRWLVRMVTPPGGVVLDPFAGTGTTGIAAMREGVNAVLIEADAQYVADIKNRLAMLGGGGTPLFVEAAQ